MVQAMAKLMVVEENESLRDELSTQLRLTGYRVETAAHTVEAIGLMDHGRHDGVVLGIGLPGLDGLDLLDWIRAREPFMPVLILVEGGAMDVRQAALQRGADDCLPKPVQMSELLSRLGSLVTLSHLPVFDPQTPVNASLRVDPLLPRAWISGQPAELTHHEWELLGLLVEQTGRVVTHDAVLAACQDTAFEALEGYMLRLRRKLADSGWAIRNIRGLGYMLEHAAA